MARGNLRMKAWEKENKLNRDRTLEFFDRLDYSVAAVGVDRGSDWAEIESSYRILHHSAKMYTRYQDATAWYLEKLFSLVGEKPLGLQGDYTIGKGMSETQKKRQSNLLRLLRYWRFETIFQDMVRKQFSLEFTPDRNKMSLWTRDASILIGTYSVVRDVALCTYQVVKDLQSTKHTFLFGTGALDWHEAVFLEAWAAIGSSLRYSNDKSCREWCQKSVHDKFPLASL